MPRDYKVSRASMEKAEGLETSTNKQAPDARFQQTQQVNKADVALDATTPATDFSAKKIQSKGSVLKQEAVASVLTGEGDYAGGPVATGTSANSAAKAGLKTLSYSGDAGTILGNASSTPVLSQADRGKGRFDKKLDSVNKKINYLASEQFLIEYDQPAPLANNDGVQGYNGTPKNSTARLQKKSGSSSAELLYDRSVDEILRDEILFSTGQIVRQTGTVYNDGLTKIPVENKDGTLQYDDNDQLVLEDNPAVRCNAINTEITVTFSKDSGGAYVSNFTPVSSANTDKYDEATVNSSNTNVLIDMNSAEIARQHIDSKAGRESQADWSPLGRATYDPSGIIGYLRDTEVITGSELFAAYHFATKAFAYQLNKASKDGQVVHRPMREMFMDRLEPKYESGDETTSGNIFKDSDYAAGSAALMMAIFDSPNKYSTKADILTQPRGLRMHFQTADNNINVFRLKPEFVSALNARDVFSTIDREYDPLMPVCIADNFSIVHPYKFSDLMKFTRDGSAKPRVYSSKLVQYTYADRNSDYRIKVANPLLAGLAYFLEQHADRIHSALGGGNGDHVLHIPIVHSTTTFSLWDWLLLASVPYIQYERTNALKDVLDFEVNFEYPFTQLKTIEEMNPVAAVNYTIKDKDSPLICGKMLPSTAISWVMPETFMTVRNSTFTLLPWYFNEDQFDVTASGDDSLFTQKDWSGSMSFPVIRSGARLSYLDMFYGMSERDIRLCLDRLVVVPGVDNAAVKGLIYKYSQAADGIPALTIPSGLTGEKYINTPRELGWFMVAPYGVMTTQPTKSLGFITLTSSSYRMRSYYGAYGEQASYVPLGSASVSINRGQNFAQNWKMVYAHSGAENPDIGMALYPCDGLEYIRFSGMSVTDGHGIRCQDLDVADNRPKARQFAVPFTTGLKASGSMSQVVSKNADYALANMGLGSWAMLQKLPFIINPFQMALCSFEDPFDHAYLFNFAGFMASDYNEDVFNRINEVQNKGWLYVSDPFVSASPIFKDAAKYTQV